MSLVILILREIRHRRGSFLLASAGAAAAVAVVVCSAALLEWDRQETARILAARSAEVEQRVAAREAAVERAGAELQDAIRKHMTKLGFNVLILPQEQDLAELHLEGTLSATMPESYAAKLAESGIVTVNHLLPLVTRRLTWPERNTEIVLVGTRGETPILHRAEKKPLQEAVAPGEMVVGYELQQRLGLAEGQQVELLGSQFRVARLHPQRGTIDDVSVWIDLAQAQRLLGLENLIHGILALECECAGDRISQVRSEIQGRLPGTQVIERYSQALARAEARTQAQATATQALAAEREAGAELLARERSTRGALESRRRSLVRWLTPAVMLSAAAWVGILAWSNVRQRTEEIAVLRTIGLSRRGILGVIEGKALLVGTCGGLCGAALGLLAAWLTTRGDSPTALVGLLRDRELLQTVLLAPLAAVVLAAAASWLPAQIAADQDPAVLLEAR
jgi:hypothetical protein